MSVYEYGVRDGQRVIEDPDSWHCVSDVMASYHGGHADSDGRVIGVLVRRPRGSSEDWETVPPPCACPADACLGVGSEGCYFGFAARLEARPI